MNLHAICVGLAIACLACNVCSAPPSQSVVASSSSQAGATRGATASSLELTDVPLTAPASPSVFARGASVHEPIEEPGALHEQQLLIEPSNQVLNLVPWYPYLSEDGAWMAVLQAHPGLSPGPSETELVVYDMTTGSAQERFPIWGAHRCDGVDGEVCAKRRSDRVKPANAYLAGRRWFLPLLWRAEHPPIGAYPENKYCTIDWARRNFQIGMYHFKYEPPRLQITREDGVQVADRRVPWATNGVLPGCRQPVLANLQHIVIEERFGLIVVVTVDCHEGECPGSRHVLVIRLPSDGVRSNPEVSTKTFVPPPPPPEVHKESDSGGF